MNDSYMESLREIRDMFFPFFTLIEMEMYIDTYPPSEENEPYDDLLNEMKKKNEFHVREQRE